MLTKQQKQEWIDALRSGEYTQGRGALCRQDMYTRESTYCCLGVLYDAVFDAEWYLVTGDDVSSRNLTRKWRPGPGAGVFYLPHWVELEPTIQATLATMNDNGSSFEHIARWIEANVETEE